jgi:hypothetical protein
MDKTQNNLHQFVSQTRSEIRKLQTGDRSASAFSFTEKSETTTLVCEVVDPVKYGKTLTAQTGGLYVRLLSGSSFIPVSEFVFFALNATGITFSFNSKVLVVYGPRYPPIIQSGFGVSGAGSSLLRIHGHFGWGDGGFSNFLSGGY